MTDYATCSICGEGIDITTPYVHGEPGGGMAVGPSRQLHHVPGTHPGCDGHPTCLFCRADRSKSGSGTAAVHAARMEELAEMGSPFGNVDMDNPINAEIVKDLLARREDSLANGPRIGVHTTRTGDLDSAFAEGAKEHLDAMDDILPPPPPSRTPPTVPSITVEEQEALDNEIVDAEIVDE